MTKKKEEIRREDVFIKRSCENLAMNEASNKIALEDRRKISRLTLLYKSIHNIVAINIDEHYTNH